MKKIYEKPELTKRDKLCAIAAADCTASNPCPG